MKSPHLRLIGGAAIVAVAAVLLAFSLRSSGPATAPATAGTPAAAADACLGRTCATVRVNFAGSGSSRAAVSASCSIPAGASAWDCVRQAIGIENIQSQDFGGSLGIFIVGLFGAAPNFGACGCFWEFVANGVSSDVGVSAYVVRPGDTLQWRIGK